MPSHTMELPRLIIIGNKNIGNIGKFLDDLAKTKKSFVDFRSKCKKKNSKKN